MPTIHCPQCPAKLKLPDGNFAGKKVNCPRCGHRFVIGAEAPLPLAVVEEPVNDFAPPSPAEARAPRSSGGMWKVAVPIATLLLGALIAVAAMSFLGGDGKSDEKKVAKNDKPADTKKETPRLPRLSPIEPPKTKVDPPPVKPDPVRPEPVKPGPDKPEPEPEPPTETTMPEPVATARPADGKPLLVLDAGGHTSMIKHVEFAADAKQIITVSLDKTIRFWDVTTGEPTRTLRLPAGPGQDGSIYVAALSEDGTRFAVGGSPFGRGKHGILIHVINLATGEVEHVLKGHKNVVLGLAFSRDGRYLASSSNDNTARIYDLTTGNTVQEFIGHTDRVKRVVFSPDGKMIATASRDNTARIWSVANGKQLALLNGHTTQVNCVAWSPDGRIIATGAVDGTIRTWQPDGKPARVYQHKNEPIIVQITALDFSPNGQELLYTGIAARGRAGILDLVSGDFRIEFKQHTNTVLHGSFSKDGSLAVSAGGDNMETYIWKTEDGAVVQELVGPGKSIWGLGWSADGKQLAWGNVNRGDTIKGKTPLEFSFNLEQLELGPTPGENFKRTVLERDGYSLEATDFFTIAIKRDGKLLHTFKLEQQERIYSASMLPGKRAVIGGAYHVYLVSCETGKILHDFTGNSGLTLAIAPTPDGKLFVTGGTDQTIYLWHPDQKLPLLSLFFADRNWIAWHPEGFYAASPYGERLMGWQINHGPDVMASFHPAVRFRKSLYQPEVIRRLPGAGSLQQAILVARKAGHDVNDVAVAQVLPPRVSITTPNKPVRSEKAEIEIQATAESVGDHPVLAMRLLIDGRPYRGEQGIRKVPKPAPGKVSATWKVKLPPGKHLVAVQAESKVSKAVTPPLRVTYTKPVRPPNLYVLAIGISAYPGELKLEYAAKDARVLSEAFKTKTKGVFAKVEAKVLTDADATRANIIKEIGWLKQKMTANDVAILSFSGHGDRDTDGQFYLIPVDVNISALSKSCVSGAFLKQALENMPGRIVAILDACHSGTLAEPAKKRAVRAADDLVRDLITEDYGVVVMCSSLGREYSLESTDVGHGFFTFGLVEGMGGLADFNRDKVVYLHELDFYAALRVRQLSRGLQHPVTGRPATIRSFPVAKP